MVFPDGVVFAPGSAGPRRSSGGTARPRRPGTYRIALTGTAPCVPPDTTLPDGRPPSPATARTWRGRGGDRGLRLRRRGQLRASRPARARGGRCSARHQHARRRAGDRHGARPRRERDRRDAHRDGGGRDRSDRGSSKPGGRGTCRAGGRGGRGLRLRQQGRLRARVVRGRHGGRCSARHEHARRGAGHGHGARPRRQRDRRDPHRHRGGRAPIRRRRSTRRRTAPSTSAASTWRRTTRARDEPNGSGIDSCVGDVADGADVDTSTLGEHTFTVHGHGPGREHRFEDRHTTPWLTRPGRISR